MGRLQGSKNKEAETRPYTLSLPPQERIRFLANLIVDKIIEDQKNNQPLLKNIC